LTAGLMLVALGAIGIVLPLLPTTPLLLLAAWCFARSSETCHRWLAEHRIFGPAIRNWQESRCIAKKDKVTAVALITVCGIYAIGFALKSVTLRIVGGAVLLCGLWFVLRIPVCRRDRG
jgi:uncharacterized membrane protein YbaN (DUF454 family)